MLTKAKQKLNSAVNKLKRSRHRPKAKPQPRVKTASVSSQKSRRIQINYRFAIIGAVTVIVAIFLILVVIPATSAVLAFDLHPDSRDGGMQTTPWYGNSRLAILAVGLDKTDDGHTFVDALTLFVVDPELKTVAIFSVNPDYAPYIPSINSSAQLRTIFGNRKATDNNQIKLIVEGVENLLALRVDRYVVMNKQQFNNLAQYLGPVQVDLNHAVYDKDVQANTGASGWSAGRHILSQSEILPFLESDVNGRDDQYQRHLQVISELVKSSDSFANIIKAPQILTSISQNVTTNISKQELLVLLWTVFNIRSDQMKGAYTRAQSAIKVGKIGVYDQLAPISDSIDHDLASIFFNLTLAKEQARIEVLNGTSVKGLAANRSRWISNLGGHVIRFDTSPESADITKIYVNDRAKYPVTLHELEKIFNGKVEYPDSDYPEKHIGDIIVVIGQDYE